MSPPRRRLCYFRPRFAVILHAVHRMRRHRRWLRKREANNSGSKASSAQINNHQGADNMRQQPLFEKLPEDILHHIHSLLPVQDAACAACVSRAFLRSWRCYSKLILNNYDLHLTHINSYDLHLTHIKNEKRKIIDKVDKILKNHHDNGVKVETLNLILSPYNSIKASYVDRWLQRTVNSGFKNLYLEMPLFMKKIYNFPCSVLSDEGAASSIQVLKIMSCAFHPTSTLGCLRRLKIVSLFIVHITEEGLEHLFSKSPVLRGAQNLMQYCSKKKISGSGIIRLKILCTMQHLKILDVRCNTLRVVEIDAPNLCYFRYDNAFPTESALPEIYVRNCSQLKHVELSSSHRYGVFFMLALVFHPSHGMLSLILDGCTENVNTPLLHSKLPHLKNLEIDLAFAAGFPPSYDLFSLVSFLDASPALESFTLHVNECATAHYPVVGDDEECPRRKLNLSHNRLRHVTITGFCSAKSLVEVTVYILESTHLLERLALDTTYKYNRCIQGPGTIGKCPTSSKIGRCWWMSKRAVEEGHRAVKTVGRYIAGRVPLAVQFELLEPCSQCHPGSQ